MSPIITSRIEFQFIFCFCCIRPLLWNYQNRITPAIGEEGLKTCRLSPDTTTSGKCRGSPADTKTSLLIFAKKYDTRRRQLSESPATALNYSNICFSVRFKIHNDASIEQMGSLTCTANCTHSPEVMNSQLLDQARDVVFANPMFHMDRIFAK